MNAKVIRIKNDELVIPHDPTHAFTSIDGINNDAVGSEFNIAVK